jgi:hypothetical protein
MSESETSSNTQNRDSERSTMSQNVAQTSSSHSNSQTSIPDLYHLVSLENYGTWAFRMKNVLQRDGLYEYCITAPSQVVSENERDSQEDVEWPREGDGGATLLSDRRSPTTLSPWRPDKLGWPKLLLCLQSVQ